MKNHQSKIVYLLSLLIAAFVWTPLWAADQKGTLIVALESLGGQSMDPIQEGRPTNAHIQAPVFDSLLGYNYEKGGVGQGVATSWVLSDDGLSWTFHLRKDVKWHNGDLLTAHDVKFSLERTMSKGSLSSRRAQLRRNVTKIEVVDDYTVRIMLKEKFPAAIEFLSGPVSIYPSDYYAEAGPEGMGLKPVGTGPYKVVDVTPGQHFVLEKYEGYHDSPKGQPTIGKVDIRTIPDVNTQIAELFSGTLDMIWQVPSDQSEKLEQMGQFTVANESTMRVGYLAMDAAGRSGEGPFTDVRVRQAVNHAINREELVEALLKGKSQVISTPCFPSQFGCDVDAAVSYDYDPEKAKALLAEAGYPDGFTTDFYAYRDREYAEAISSYLNAVGIQTNFKMLQYSALRELNMKGETPISFQTWGSYSVNDASAMVSQFFKHGSLDDARDDETLGYLDIADSSTDPEVRKENYAKAIERITEEAYWAPMFSYNTNYVYTNEVAYTPTADEVLRFTTMTWN